MIPSVTHWEMLSFDGAGGPDWLPPCAPKLASRTASRLAVIRLSPPAAVSSRRTPMEDWFAQSNASVLESAAHEMVWEAFTPEPVNPAGSTGSSEPCVDQLRNAPVASV